MKVPSFQPATDCPVPPYPLAGVHLAVSGIVNDTVIICGGKCVIITQYKIAGYSAGAVSKCYLLAQGTWHLHHSLTTGRYAAAASMTGVGWMVSGGKDAAGTRLSSTEVLTAEGWVPGPPLPEPLSGHCQVTLGDTVIVAGMAGLLWGI